MYFDYYCVVSCILLRVCRVDDGGSRGSSGVQHGRHGLAACHVDRRRHRPGRRRRRREMASVLPSRPAARPTPDLAPADRAELPADRRDRRTTDRRRRIQGTRRQSCPWVGLTRGSGWVPVTRLWRDQRGAVAGPDGSLVYVLQDISRIPGTRRQSCPWVGLTHGSGWVPVTRQWRDQRGAVVGLDGSLVYVFCVASSRQLCANVSRS